ncbi:TIGR02453 family protein [Mucilaginibacter sp. PAMC 26640]|nr:TIGR02453 family protein [Mucilaginibacter sp. PAMC 26640]
MIQVHTLDFLKELVENNNREWFQANKERYDKARENVIELAAGLIAKIHQVDAGVSADLDPKKSVMRIYRDIRFSKNKIPYKNNFGVSIPSHGVKLGGVEYYLQIQPGKSFIAGGYWMPEAEHLKAIRQEIDYNAADLKKIVDDPEFVKLFGELRKQDQLKTAPRDYSPDNENIELLKLKSFIVMHPLTDKDVLGAKLTDKILNACEKLYPLNVFLKNAIG